LRFLILPFIFIPQVIRLNYSTNLADIDAAVDSNNNRIVDMIDVPSSSGLGGSGGGDDLPPPPPDSLLDEMSAFNRNGCCFFL
jgi:hypothetical protein